MGRLPASFLSSLNAVPVILQPLRRAREVALVVRPEPGFKRGTDGGRLAAQLHLHQHAAGPDHQRS